MNENKDNNKVEQKKYTRPGNAQKSLFALIILAIVIVGFIIVVKVATNLFEEEQVIPFKNNEFNEEEDYTYRFTGETEHFYFETGQVLYNGASRYLHISGIKVKEDEETKEKKKNEPADVSYAFNIYFDNKIVFGNKDNVGGYTAKDLENIRIGVYGTYNKDQKDTGSPYDPFILTTAKTFKDSIKVEGIYCKKDKCQRENFKLYYFEKEKEKK